MAGRSRTNEQFEHFLCSLAQPAAPLRNPRSDGQTCDTHKNSCNCDGFFGGSCDCDSPDTQRCQYTTSCDYSCNSCSGAACNTGKYGTPSECNRSPATGSVGCSTCTNKPANSAYTGGSTTNACPYVCNAGFYRSGLAAYCMNLLSCCTACTTCSGASSYQVSDCQADGESNDRVCAIPSLCVVEPAACNGSYIGTVLCVLPPPLRHSDWARGR